jgi:hypothetical protein
MGGHVSHGNRETSERCLQMSLTSYAEPAGKANRRNLAGRAPEESDGDVVPGKSANKGMKFPAEWMEERSSTKRNAAERPATRTLGRIDCVRRFWQRASERALLLDVGAVCGSTARTDLRGEGLHINLCKSFYRNYKVMKR